MKACLFTDRRNGPSPTEFILLVSSQNLDRAVSYFSCNPPAPQPADRTLAKIFAEVTAAFHGKAIFEARDETNRKRWRMPLGIPPSSKFMSILQWYRSLTGWPSVLALTP